MRPSAPLLLLLLAATALTAPADEPSDLPSNDAPAVSDDTVLNDAANDTLVDSDGEHEPVVRKKRTFGDIVFRGLADVLGYNVARKPPLAPFPPPLAPVPGIDTPLQAAVPIAPAPAPAAPAPAPAVAPPPCGTPRAAAPPPCRAQRPPPPPKTASPPCPKPRAAPRPKPRPPPPPSPPPCARPRANPTTPSPCTPAPSPPPPPPKQQVDPNLETISSNFQLNFNFNRSPATTASPAADGETEAEPEAEAEQAPAPIAPIAIEPRAAKLPPAEPRKSRVYVDAFLVRDGVARRVDALDAKHLSSQGAVAADEDYLAYDEEQEQPQYDDYEDAQESRDRTKAVRDFSTAVDRFWEKKTQGKSQPQKFPANHYQNVHFGDRDLAGQVRLQSLQQQRAHPNRIPLSLPEDEDDAEATTTTENPRKPLRPRVLPPTEHNPNQIDTVTVRVPPIYKEKRPKKLHRERPEQPDRDDEGTDDSGDFGLTQGGQSGEHDSDTESDDSWLEPHTERPRRKRRRKQSRKARSVNESDHESAGNYDYYGKKLPISDEEKFFMQLTVPTPTKDADLARIEAPEGAYFLDDHERLREDPERIREDKKSDKKGRRDDTGRADNSRAEDSGAEDSGAEDSGAEDSGADDSGRSDDWRKSDDSEEADESERSTEDRERANSQERANERERDDELSPNAQVHETGYQNNYVHATNVEVVDPNPAVHTV